jgi:hypothetical protein
MAWVRIHDGAMTNPKIAGLSDKAFRLWVWGLSYAQQHLTDGVLAPAALGTMPARLARATDDLTTRGLWERHECGGFQIHDYLDWNDSRDTVLKKRGEAKDRMAHARASKSPPVLQRTSPRTFERTSHEVLRGLGKSSDVSERTEDLTLDDRARVLREERYPEWYAKYRHGARLRVPLIANTLEFQEALSVVQTWDDARIEKLARVFLTTDEDWIASTDRGFRLFCSKATWCDDKLREWERTRGIA